MDSESSPELDSVELLDNGNASIEALCLDAESGELTHVVLRLHDSPSEPELLVVVDDDPKNRILGHTLHVGYSVEELIHAPRLTGIDAETGPSADDLENSD